MVKAFQDLTIRKWQEYLDRKKAAPVRAANNVVSAPTHPLEGVAR